MDNQAVRDCEEQLAQVRERIADALKSRERAPSQRAWREVNQRLHRLYMLEYDVRQDLAKVAA